MVGEITECQWDFKKKNNDNKNKSNPESAVISWQENISTSAWLAIRNLAFGNFG